MEDWLFGLLFGFLKWSTLVVRGWLPLLAGCSIGVNVILGLQNGLDVNLSLILNVFHLKLSII